MIKLLLYIHSRVYNLIFSIMDYRTKRSGINEKDLENTSYFEDVRETDIRILEVIDVNIYINYIHNS